MVTPTNRKPASYWVMLVIVFIAFVSVAATAKAEQSTAGAVSSSHPDQLI